MTHLCPRLCATYADSAQWAVNSVPRKGFRRPGRSGATRASLFPFLALSASLFPGLCSARGKGRANGGTSRAKEGKSRKDRERPSCGAPRNLLAAPGRTANRVSSRPPATQAWPHAQTRRWASLLPPLLLGFYLFCSDRPFPNWWAPHGGWRLR